MARRAAIVAILVLAIMVSPLSLAGFGGQRIVMPYGQSERHLPVIAGYEVTPTPLPCGVGTPGSETATIYENDFDRGLPALEARNAVQVFVPFGVRVDLFHETDFVGKGTDIGGDRRLYFGIETYDEEGEPMGSYKFPGARVAGVAAIPAMTLPSEPTYLSWNEKFEVEALLGYDHTWIEIQTLDDNAVYILCTSDPLGRPDPGKNDTTSSACSPYRIGICPNGLNGGFGTDYAIGEYVDAGVIPLETLDPTAPHWHARYVEIPAFFAGRNAEIRFSFDTADPTSNVHMGWMIDDTRVFTGTIVDEPLAYLPPVPALR